MRLRDQIIGITLCFGIGLVLTGIALWTGRYFFWHKEPVQIIQIGIIKSTNANPDLFEIRAFGQYPNNDKPVQFNTAWNHEDSNVLRSFGEKYLVGQTLNIWINPFNKEEAVWKREFGSFFILLSFGIICLGVGFIIIAQSVNKSVPSFIPLILFSISFMGMGIGASIDTLYKQLFWDGVRGRIEHVSSYTITPVSNSRTKELTLDLLLYTFEKSGQVLMDGNALESRKSKDKLDINGVVSIYSNPKDPMHTDVQTNVHWLTFLLMAIGPFGLIVSFYQWRSLR